MLVRVGSLHPKESDQKKATEKIVRMMADQALVVPLWKAPVGIRHQSYVHTSYDLTGFILWASYHDWM
jgi:hypothetical protein